MTKFSDLGLAAPILKALQGEGYMTPTPIQVKAIPAVLAGSDLVGIAQTGTGKTAAFALPILHRLAADRRAAAHKGCRVLVLSPTRELAAQIADSFRVYGRHLNLTIVQVFGGVAKRPQILALQAGVDVLIATPGRLLDHVAAGNANLAGTEILVLDEADRMLDLGFAKPIRRIVSHLSTKRQTLFFSATMPPEITRLTHDFLREPVKVTIAPVGSTADRIDQRVVYVEQHKKRALLAELLANPHMSRTLVFTRTKHGADRLARHLESSGIGVAAIHGNKSQGQRERALHAFRKSKIQVLVATDIAARGIDVDAVSHVVNFELPEVAEAYVHRIGRTARAGAAGSAISLCDDAERNLLRAIERLTRQSIPSDDRRRDAGLSAGVEVKPTRDGRANRKGGRARPAGTRRAGTPGRGERAAGQGRPNRRGEGQTNRTNGERVEKGRGDHLSNLPQDATEISAGDNGSALSAVGFMAGKAKRNGRKAGDPSAKRDGASRKRASAAAQQHRHNTADKGRKAGRRRGQRPGLDAGIGRQA